jgi:hypothetical protein
VPRVSLESWGHYEQAARRENLRAGSAVSQGSPLESPLGPERHACYRRSPQTFCLTIEMPVQRVTLMPVQIELEAVEWVFRRVLHKLFHKKSLRGPARNDNLVHKTRRVGRDAHPDILRPVSRETIRVRLPVQFQECAAG